MYICNIIITEKKDKILIRLSAGKFGDLAITKIDNGKISHYILSDINEIDCNEKFTTIQYNFSTLNCDETILRLFDLNYLDLIFNKFEISKLYNEIGGNTQLIINEINDSYNDFMDIRNKNYLM